MPAAIVLRTDYSASELRRLAKASRDNNQSRRLLSLAAVLDGMNRTDAARIGGMDRQTLRDWSHRFNEFGPDGLLDRHGGGVEARNEVVERAGRIRDDEAHGARRRPRAVGGVQPRRGEQQQAGGKRGDVRARQSHGRFLRKPAIYTESR